MLLLILLIKPGDGNMLTVDLIKKIPEMNEVNEMRTTNGELQSSYHQMRSNESSNANGTVFRKCFSRNVVIGHTPQR